MNAIIGIVCLAGIVVMYYFHRQEKNRLKKVKDSRPALSREEFFDHFRNREYSDSLIEVCYFVTRKRIKMKDFSIYPDDNIVDLLNLTQMEMKDFITDICLGLNVALPKQIEIDKFMENGNDLETISDIVEFVHHTRIGGYVSVNA